MVENTNLSPVRKKFNTSLELISWRAIMKRCVLEQLANYVACRLVLRRFLEGFQIASFLWNKDSFLTKESGTLCLIDLFNPS